MKYLLRRIFVYTFALFLLPFLVSGVTVTGGFWTLLLCGFVLTLLFVILKPVLNLISMPANILTLGLFSVFNSALILYLLTVFVGSVSIESFTYPRTDFLGVIIPVLNFNTFFAYIYTAFVLSFIDSILSWLMN